MNVAQLLQEANTVSVLLPLQPQETDTQEALLLVCGLKQLGKQISLISGQLSLPSEISFKEKTFVVSLKGLAPKVARVRYEKEENDLKLYFTLNQGGLSPETLSIESQASPDLICIVGNSSLQNNGGSQIPTISSAEAKPALFGFLKSHEDAQTKLLGIVLSNLEYVPRFELFVALIPKQELSAIEGYAKILPLAIMTMQKTLQGAFSFLILFDAPRGSQGLLWSASPRLRTKFRDMSGGQQKGPWVLLRPTPLSSQQLKHAFLS